MRIDWTRRASRELEAKADWLAENRPGAAGPFLTRITEAVEKVRKFPLRGRRLPEFDDEPVREIIVGTHRIIYLPEDERLLVVTVKHCSEELTGDDLRPELPWHKVRNG
jgi:plasmid stabilization system protein ParE